jgi:23S rRNA (cytidine1920-2'-O)/16S rRNA (cytidine1409-2'-O)-methyltransferase
VTRRRLDTELVRRNLARSREAARELIETGRVRVHGDIARKASTMVDAAAAVVVVASDDPGYASRGARKLVGALDAFGSIVVEGRRCLDAGASTGGFTDVLLRRGAREVVAVDVGYGQLIWRLRDDPRVTVLDRTNARHLTAAEIAGPVDVIVADLSFISLTLVLPALVACAQPEADLLVMVKPQFEVGRQAVNSGGVVRDPQARIDSVHRVASVAYDLGWGTAGIVASPLPGPSGNVEYFCWLRADASAPDRALVELAVEAGP